MTALMCLSVCLSVCYIGVLYLAVCTIFNNKHFYHNTHGTCIIEGMLKSSDFTQRRCYNYHTNCIQYIQKIITLRISRSQNESQLIIPPISLPTLEI